MTTLVNSKFNTGNLDWNTIEKCAEKHFLNCAKYINQVILEFNGVSKAYNRLLSERDLNQQKYNELSQKSKKLDDCQNCALLEQRLLLQNSKFKAIADIFDQISVADSECDARSKLSLEDAHDLFTKFDNFDDCIEDKTNVQFHKTEISLKNKKDLFHMSTPQKRACLQNIQKSEESGGEIEESILHQTSPILKKTSKRTTLADNDCKKSPFKNVTNSSQEFYLSKSCKIPQHDKSSSENLETTISESPIANVSKNRENKFPSTHMVHLKFSPQQSNSNHDKKLKQSRLLLTKVKPKINLDVSKTDCFQGGMRNIATVTKQEPDDILADDETTLFEEHFNQDNADVISESPMCFKKVKKEPVDITSKDKSKLQSSPMAEEDVTSEDNRTICCIPKHSPSKSKCTPKKQTKSPSPNKLNVFYGEREMVYKEEPVRKKAEKKKLQGWSCTKCGDFYRAAFKGNDEMINKHINECSKHRGKFNPERRNTPPGFWDMNMPPTQDTEAFNKRNNRL